jgi:peptidoglycan/LPS O-acetylase OafA/YrhL
MPALDRRFYRPELDALRFFAFVIVFLFHGMEYYLADPFRNVEVFHWPWIGQWGVPLFFFLSAFLITELLLREQEQFGKVHLGSFYVRRILRIWPLYFAAFWGFALLNVWIPHVNPGVGKTWPWFTFFFANQYIAHHGWIAGPVDPLWSVSVEEQFYIFIPLILVLGGRWALRAVCAVVLLVSYFAIWRYARIHWTTDNGEWTNSQVMFQFFAGGALLSDFLRGRVPRWKGYFRLLVGAGGITCWVIAQTVFRVRGWKPFTTVPQAFAGWLLILLGCVLLLVAFLGTESQRVPKTVIYLGRISFGLYIFHSLFYELIFTYLAPHIFAFIQDDRWRIPVVWILVVCAFLSSVGLASLSYRYFERPFLRLKEKFAFIPSRVE